DVADFRHAAGIQSGRRLVEDEQVRFVEQRLSDGQALLHPFRELLDPMVRPIRELDFFEDRFAAVVEILRRHAAEPAGIGEGFQGRQVAVEFRGLDDGTNSSEGTGRLPPHIDAEEGGLPAGRPDEFGHALDGRGLARSIRTEEAKGGPLRDRQVERLEDRKSTRLNSSHQIISYAVFCLKKKTKSIVHVESLMLTKL